MKKSVVFFALMMTSTLGFSRGILPTKAEAACRASAQDDLEPAPTYIQGHTLCVKGKSFDISNDYGDEDNQVAIFDKNGRFTGEYEPKGQYCFNKGFRPLICKGYTKPKPSYVDYVLANGTSSSDNAPAGATIDGKWYPACSSSAVDPDGDSWGWENNKSCKVLN